MKYYVLFIENEKITNTNFFYYLQYNDNIDSIREFNNFLEKADYKCFLGEFSIFSTIDTNNLVLEEDALESGFVICDGLMNLPNFTYYYIGTTHVTDGYDIAGWLNDKFYYGGITKYFK